MPRRRCRSAHWPRRRRRSAAAMSGRRCSSSDGMPGGTPGGRRSSGAGGSVKLAGGRPISTAIACSYCARNTPISVACTRVVSSCVCACAHLILARSRPPAGFGSAAARTRRPSRCHSADAAGHRRSAARYNRGRVRHAGSGWQSPGRPRWPAPPHAPPTPCGRCVPTDRPRSPGRMQPQLAQRLRIG